MPLRYADFRVGVAASGNRWMTPPVSWHALFLCLCIVICVTLPGELSAQTTTPPGSIIANTALIDYRDGTGDINTVSSNQVDIVALPPRSSSSVSFLRVNNNGGNTMPLGPSRCAVQGGAFTPLPDPVLVGGIPIDPNQLQPVIDASLYHAGEPIFIGLNDPDQNLDALVIDTVSVEVSVPASGDIELLELSETGPNTGMFTGYVPTVAPPVAVNDCQLQIAEEDDILVAYQDPRNASDIATANALVDPIGFVFNSRSGLAVDGAQIELLDAVTGLPATVLGDDGLASFPSLIASGGQATDSGGTLYSFATGSFRYPVVPDGRYILVVTPPDGFTAPSVVDPIDLQNLPNAPFSLSDGSFGLPFDIAGPIINLDIPLDPVQSGLFVQKTASVNLAAPGDFVQYSVTVDNPDVTGAQNVVVVDQLPFGFKYVEGSTLLDGVSGDDPVVDSDGRTLRFAVGDLESGASVRIQYVAEVTVGVRQEQATNTATALSDNGVDSNVATATIQIVEDLFRSQSILVGRVLQGCPTDEAESLGVPGIRVYLEDGRYAVTDEDGRYHFEAVEPGNHVVQMDRETITDTLEPVACEQNSRFAGRSFSRFVDLRPGSLWRADFYLDQKPIPEGVFKAQLEVDRLKKHDLSYRLGMSSGIVVARNPQAMIMLPKGFDYILGSARLDQQPLDDPRINGRVLTFDLADQPAESQRELEFHVATDTASSGQWVSKALVSIASEEKTVRTPTAEVVVEMTQDEPTVIRKDHVSNFSSRSIELSNDDKQRLQKLVSEIKPAKKLTVTCVGHADARPIAIKNQHEYPDNNALSYARAEAVADYLQQDLGIKKAKVTIEGAGSSRPIASNTSNEGRKKNRRVELSICAEAEPPPGKPKLTQAKSPELTVSYKPSIETRVVPENEAPQEQDTLLSYNDEGWVDKVEPGNDWLLPTEHHNPPIPSIKIALRHDPNHQVELKINGEPVSSLNFDGTAVNAKKTVAISRWRGVDLQDGNNQLEAVFKSEKGEILQRLGRAVHFSEGPSRGVLDIERSNLVADGTTRPVIAVRLFDRWGKPARPDTLGELRVDPPYRSWWEVQAEQENQLVGLGAREPRYTVGSDGVALIELAPTAQTGEVVIHLNMPNNREEEIRAWLKPAPRDWILVGLAEGTLGYNTINDNVENALDAGVEDEIYQDGRVAFFAKGQIQGKYLLTMALDTGRDRANVEDQLLGTIDPDRFYTLYGDTTEQYFEAPSQRKIYLKLERNQFVALFGDYETGLTVTELTRYNRTFNGIKSEYYGDRFQYSAFATETNQAFVKDEIQGDGTSGLYFLSRKPIIINSEKINLEARDRFRSEVIVWTRTLTRHIDYDIDYLQGTLFFKQPVQSRDDNFNPVFIVADYESRDSADENAIAGGRAALKFQEGNLEVGTSFIHEGVEGGDGELYGADFRWQIDDVTELRAEAAHSESEQGVSREGDAYLVEVTRRSSRVDGRVYARQQDAEFGLGQQRAAESGTRKLGMDARLQLTDRLNLNGEVYRQRVLSTGVDRDVAQAEVRYQQDGKAAGIGIRHAADEDASGVTQRSDQLFLSGSTLVMDKKLTLRGTAETALNSRNASSDFPTRSILGADYHVDERITLFSEYEFGDGSQQDSHLFRVGVKASPWDRAQFSTSVDNQITENGSRLFATTGLTQGWQLNERWAIDVGLDHSDTLRDPGVEPFNENVPLASGTVNGDFTAVFVGALYRSDLWTSNSRIEYRSSQAEDRLGLFTGFHREAVKGKAFAASLQFFDSKQAAAADLVNAQARLSWAYRPNQSRWVILDRLDLIYDDRDDGANGFSTWRVVNNFNANWKPNTKNQFGFQYGAKLVRSQIGDDSFNGYTDLLGFDYRRDLNKTWDVGIQGSTLRSWSADVVDYSWGVDVGVSFATNMWLSVGYNIDGFEDDDFSLSRYTAHGPYIQFRLKADQDSFKRIKEDLKPDDRRIRRAQGPTP